MTETPTIEAFNRMAREVERINEELAALKRDLATEVRTRSVVVVDELGGERINLATGAHFGEIRVRGRDADAPYVNIYANEELGQPVAGIIIPAGPHTVTQWETTVKDFPDAPEARFELLQYGSDAAVASNGGIQLRSSGIVQHDQTSQDPARSSRNALFLSTSDL